MALRLFAATLLMAAVAACATATTILALRTPEMIIVLADSKPTYRGYSGPGAVCKISPLRGAFVAVAGLDHDTARDFDSKKLAVAAFDSPRSFREHVRDAEHLVQKAGETEMRRLRAEDPETYRFTLDNGSNIIDLLFVAFESDTPMMSARRFHWRESTASIEIAGALDCPGKDCPNGTYFTWVGKASEIEEFVQSHSNPSLNEKVLRELLLKQIAANPNDVGLPITILKLDSTGAHWDNNELACPPRVEVSVKD
jgi:hypothetical protein